MKKMLDTNICIYIIKNKPQSVLDELKKCNVGDIILSSITVSELIYGAHKSQFVEKNLKAIEHFLIPFDVAEYDYKAALEYGKLRASLEKKGQPIGSLDMLIAAHAKSLDMVLVTNNMKEFERVEGLNVENWVR
ncbi:putative toxin protein, VapC-like [Sulfurospirillum multivorans DSM 12446]|uniref:Ribonuclease VapC n=3 Tax=Sulfurospirillum multivorans TaxID=66821 RepID=A0AA86DZL1_SULMK|nr:putative toxin protein, VapC-like [Sulfurospirillum multivorans DSM 12446]QEH06080.1 putative toxin protein, VapC-like [Sulfurospirillum multivorans]